MDSIAEKLTKARDEVSKLEAELSAADLAKQGVGSITITINTQNGSSVKPFTSLSKSIEFIQMLENQVKMIPIKRSSPGVDGPFRSITY